MTTFAPAPPTVLFEEATVLLAGLRVFSDNDTDKLLMIKPFVDVLADVPADVAVAALRKGRKHGRGVQAEDIHADAVTLASERYRIRWAMQWTMKNTETFRLEAMTEEERAARRREVREYLDSSASPQQAPA